MDLRDQFAIAAMQAALGQIAELGPELMKLVAAEAYEMADAMIAERESGSVDSVHSIKQALVQAIKDQRGLDVSQLTFFTSEQLITILTQGRFGQ